TPIIAWLHEVQTAGGVVDQFNQTVLLQAPPQATEADVAVVVQALLDRHAMLRCRVSVDEAGQWSLQVPEAGSVHPHVQVVDVVGDEALVAARSALNPAAGVMVSALWAASTRQLALIVHHLAVDAVSWRILVEDLNIAWAQHHHGQPIVLPVTGTSFARWAAVLGEHARAAGVVEQADRWQQLLAIPSPLPSVQAECDTYASAGHLTASLDVETTRMLLGEVPAAFHAGIQDILLIAYGLALSQLLGSTAPLAIDVEGHGRHDELGPDLDLSRTVGWFTTKYPVALTISGLHWSQV
ncbi:condensation domain-containing protein, partial [Mycobacterium kyorinense]|uniref:condensation domain-containing protein n=1 Tax=Mycobacterium kyorinense TaxID=487514 RepID=UPI001E3A8F40